MSWNGSVRILVTHTTAVRVSCCSTSCIARNTSPATPSASQPARSRIDGVLHRRMPAALTVRDIADRAVADQRLYLTLSVSSETPYLRAGGWDEPWVEVLGHNPDEVDLSRLNGGAPILANHDRYAAVGNTPLAGLGAAAIKLPVKVRNPSSTSITIIW